MSEIEFTKRAIGRVVNETEPGAMNTLSAIGDINGNGRTDVLIGGRNGKIVWFENHGRGAEWEQHLVDVIDRMECGGTLFDLTGNGRLDLINGTDWRGDEISWWENPGETDGRWERHLIAKTGRAQFHDTFVGDVKNDRSPYLAFTNQVGGTTIYCVPLPDDPHVSPWPGLEMIGQDKTEANPHNLEMNPSGRQPEEGLAIGDIDGDGQNELVCGTHWYKFTEDGWIGHKFASDYITTKVAIGDVDGDGQDEIVLSEGDAVVAGKTQGGKLAWFKPGSDITQLWKEYPLDDGLLDPHSLQLGDLTGNGKLDIFVGEVGAAGEQDEYVQRPPRLIIYRNEGAGQFSPYVIDEGTGTHDAVLVDVDGDGKLDIVGKPLHGPEKWHVHVWYNDSHATAT